MRFHFSYVLVAAAALGAACTDARTVAEPAAARTTSTTALLAIADNAPADMTIASERAFSALVEDGWSQPTSSNVTITQASDAPRSAPAVAQFRYPAGMSGGSSPDIVERSLGTPAPALYLSFWFRVSSNFAGNGTNQLFYVRMGTTSRLTVALEGNSRQRLRPVVSVRNVRNYGGDAVLSPNLAPNTRVDRGTWHQFEVTVASNTGGSADGIVEWWYDGAKIGSYEDIAFVTASQSHTWSAISLSPVWGGTGGHVPSTQYLWLDHLILSTGDSVASQPNDQPPPALPEPVATVQVSLASSTIGVGQTTQATATLRDANGNVLTDRSVAWSSSNAGVATVSSNGLVTAQGAGTASIVATSENKQGSATLTVQSAPPPPPSGSNEPAGMTLITERPFNALGENGWYDDNAPSKYSIVQDASAPMSPSAVGQQRFAAGMSGGGSPAVAEKGIGGRNTIYISYWVKISSNWVGHSSGVNKQIFVWSDGQPTVYTSAQGSGSGDLSPEVRLQGSGGTTNLSPNLVPNATFTRGVWHRWELVLVGNTSGGSNGSATWWIDGVKVGAYTNVRFTSGSGAWQIFQWSPIWGGTGGSIPADQFMWMDQIRISGQ